MTGVIATIPKFQFSNATGTPLANGTLTVYLAGTTTLTNTWQDYALTSLNTNPVTLDSRGECVLWLDSAVTYKFVLKNSSGVVQWTLDNLTNAAALTNALRSDLSASSGSSIIGYTSANGAAKILQAELRALDLKTVNVQDYVTGGLGTSASPWTGWDTGIVWAGNQYDFIDGYYSYATSPNFAINYLKLNGKAGTVIKHTGSGYAMTVDAGALSANLIVLLEINCRLEGNSGSTGGVFCRGISRSKFDMKFRNIPGICFRDIYSVLNLYTLTHTAIGVAGTIFPNNLISIEKRNAGEFSSANTYSLIAENCQATGVVLNDCVNSVFICGTSEANASGYFISNTSNYNTFINIDLEVNTNYDLQCFGAYNNFIGVLSSTNVTFNGKRNFIQGGIYNIVNSSGVNNVFSGVSYANNSGPFTETGTATRKHDVFNITSSLYDLDIIGFQSTVTTSAGNTGSAGNATPITIATMVAPGIYRVAARLIAGTGTPSAYSSIADVQWDGSAGRITANNGTNVTLSISGANIQVAQATGATQPAGINWSTLVQSLP
jgi:hypothetical protein